jgi:hypothetical protein
MDISIVHSENMALSVEQVALIAFNVSKNSVWEIFLGAVHLHLDNIAVNLLPRVIIYEMIVNFGLVVEESHKYLSVIYEAADYEWIREPRDRHREIINAQSFIEVKLVSSNVFVSSRFVAKCSDPELAIIHVDDSVLGAIIVLLYFFDLDVVLWFTTDLLFESYLVVRETVNCDMVLSIIFLRDTEAAYLVIRKLYRNNWVAGGDVLAS